MDRAHDDIWLVDYVEHCGTMHCSSLLLHLAEPTYSSALSISSHTGWLTSLRLCRRFYLKRAQVLDVRSPTSCDIYLAEARETIAGVHQSQLETVVPRAQMARVLLVRGPLARQQAKLLDRGSEGVATVQLLEDFSVLSVRHDDIAEFVGEPGEDE